MNIAGNPEYEPPDKPHHKWTKVENLKWLSIRKLSTEGNAQVLRDRVASLLNSPGGPPPIPPPTGGGIVRVNAVVIRLHHMVSFFMGVDGTNNPRDEATISSLLIRMYLNAIHDLDIGMRDERETNRKPIWLTSYNFLSLLNLPNQISNLGPLRNRWEGGVSGEGFLRKVKPTLGSSNRINWTKNLLTTLVRQRSILALRQNIGRPEPDMEEHWMHRDSKFRTYGSLTEVEDAFEGNEPISVVVVEEPEEEDANDGDDIMIGFENAQPRMAARFFVVFRQGHAGKMLELEYGKDGPTWCFTYGLHYHQWTKSAMPIAFPHGDDGTLTITSYAVLLPQIQIGIIQNDDEADSNERYYTVTDFKWRNLGRERYLDFPHVSGNLDASSQRAQQLCVGKIMSPTMIWRVHPRLRTENIFVFRICVNENTYEKNIKHTEHLWS